jgi:hypothetical protein
VALLESLVEKHLTQNQMYGSRQTVGQSLQPKILLSTSVGTSTTTDDHGHSWT